MRFGLIRLLTESHYAFKPSHCLKRVELPLNEQIFNTIGINAEFVKFFLDLLPINRHIGRLL
ncbi:hypothetical protein [Shewanella xiamenensis]|uniref:hypothetical protein n=1 Tax=Shewanella xiamenensis TaxID=332186 RepID=UPI00118484B7|nr:hypothetical protein [Shewanella xiamenensis]